MKNLMLVIASFFLFGILLATNTQSYKIYFESGQSEVKLNQVDKKLLKGDLYYLNGYADTDGENDANLLLSQKRVQNVKALLVENGVKASNIYCNHFGEEPFNEGQNNIEKAESRIVEVKYIIDPLLKHAVETQSFAVSNQEETIIVGKEGTKLRIPANCFGSADVQIKLQEFHNPLDILSSNLSTQADGLLLETRGMVHIEATSNGQVVQPKKLVEVEFAQLGTDENEFKIFNGVLNDKMDVNWTNPRAKLSEEQGPPTTYSSSYGWMYWHTSDKNISYAFNEFSPIFINNLALSIGKVHRHMMDSTEIVLNIEKDGAVSLKSYEGKHGTEDEQKKLIKDIILACDRTKAKPSSENWLFEFTLDTIPIVMTSRDSILELYYAEMSERQKSSRAFPVTEFGWINCDRFVSPAQVTDFEVEIAPQANVRMLVKEYSAYINSSYQGKENTLTFQRIPPGQEVVLIATLSKEDKYYLAIEHTTVSKEKFTDFNFEEMSLEELQKRIVGIKL